MTHGPLYHGCTASSRLEWEARIEKTEAAGMEGERGTKPYTKRIPAGKPNTGQLHRTVRDGPLNDPVRATNHTLNPCDEEIDAKDEEETCFYAAAVEYRAFVGDPGTPAPATWHPDATKRKQRKRLCTASSRFLLKVTSASSRLKSLFFLLRLDLLTISSNIHQH